MSDAGETRRVARPWRLSLRGTTILLGIGIVATTLASGYVAWSSARHRDDTNRTLTGKIEELSLYQDARFALLDESSSVAGYFILREPRYVAQFDAARSRANTMFAALEARGAQPLPGEVLYSERHQVIAGANRNVLTALGGNDILGAAEAVAQVDLIGLTTGLLDELSQQIVDVRQELASAQARDQAAQSASFRWSITITATWGAALLLAGYACYRCLIQPLQRVSRGTRAIAAGDVSSRVPVDGPAELADLATDVNGMAESLIRRSDELNAYLSKDLEARTADLERANAALIESEERFRSLVQNGSDLITVIDADTVVVYQSPSIERVLGYVAAHVAGQRLADLLHPDDIGRLRGFLGDAMSGAGRPAAFDARLRHRDGSWRHVEIIGTDQRHDPAVAGFVLNTRDVTERKHLEEQLRVQAFHDPLTGLANRARFADRLEHALLRAARSNDGVAVLFMDLDNFKSVNDSLGHSTGDRLLIEVAGRLQACLRPGDTAARLGGDEFAILLDDASAGSAARVAERVIDVLRAPFNIDGTEVLARGSIGVAVSARGATDADELLRNADVAMYVAKSSGKARFELYEQRMHESMVERLELLGDLQLAVEHHQFVLHYQPLVLLRTGDIVGVEALVRWNHPTRGMLNPMQFIPLAEESGVIISLGAWVLAEACRQAVEWRDRHRGLPALTMSVNVSVRQIQQPDFVAEVARTIADTGIEPHTLILEVTESVMMQDARATVAMLNELKTLGIRLAIDDFGTGYSSLSYLRQFPFDILKIDRSFVRGNGDAAGDEELTRAIVDLGKTLQLETVAEGIEESEQLERLQSLDCDFGQGFLFAKPLLPAEIDDWLRNATGSSDAAA